MAVALAGVISFAGTAMSQQKPAGAPATSGTQVAPTAPAAPMTSSPMSQMEKFSGVIKGVDRGKKEITLKIGKEQKTFFFDNMTKFTEGKRELTAADLKKGMHVNLEYKKDGSRMVAESIDIMPKIASSGTHPYK